MKIDIKMYTIIIIYQIIIHKHDHIPLPTKVILNLV